MITIKSNNVNKLTNYFLRKNEGEYIKPIEIFKFIDINDDDDYYKTHFKYIETMRGVKKNLIKYGCIIRGGNNGYYIYKSNEIYGFVNNCYYSKAMKYLKRGLFIIENIRLNDITQDEYNKLYKLKTKINEIIKYMEE